jgi:hypothetical protein
MYAAHKVKSKSVLAAIRGKQRWLAPTGTEGQIRVKGDTIIATVAALVLMSLTVFFVTRSPIGQRNTSDFPKWVLRIGNRRPPGFFRTKAGLELTWLARRTIPLVLGIAGVKVFGLFTAPTNSLSTHIPLATTTWVTLAAGVDALFTAGYTFQPAKRNGPLSLWASWFGALIPIATGLIFLTCALGYSQEWLGVISWAPITSALASWTSAHSIQDAVGIAITLVGFGLAMMALQEGAPEIGDATTTPADLRLDTNPGQKTSTVRGSLERSPRRRNKKRTKNRKRRLR